MTDENRWCALDVVQILSWAGFPRNHPAHFLTFSFYFPESIKQLHDRVTHQCAEYRDLYEKFTVPEAGAKVDWARILEQKQVKMTNGIYCPVLLLVKPSTDLNQEYLVCDSELS